MKRYLLFPALRKRALYVFLLFAQLYVCGQSGKDSLQRLVNTTKQDTTRSRILNTLSRQSFVQAEYDTALRYASRALAISSAALKASSDAAIVKELKKQLAIAYKNTGNVHWIQGRYPEALQNYFTGLKLMDETGDKRGIAYFYTNIGNVYYNQGDLAGSLKSNLQALKLLQEVNDAYGIARCYNMAGLIYSEQNNHTESLKNHQLCLQAMKQVGNKHGIATSYNNIGLLYWHEDKYEEALQNYFAALKIREEINDVQGLIGSYGNIGNTYTDQKRYSEAEKYLNKGLALAREIDNKDFIKTAYSGLAQVDSAQGHYKEAYEHFKSFIAYRDSLLSEENTKKTVEMQMQYEFDKKEAVGRAEQEKKDLVAVEDKRKQQIVIIAVSGGLFLVLILAGVIFRSLRLNQKKNRIITSQKALVEKQKEMVEEKQKEILDSIHYARRIQHSLLPTEKYINKNLNRLRPPRELGGEASG